MKILLLEDNPGDARLIRELFREIQNHSVEIINAESLGQAFDHLKKSPFDVALVDLSLPDSHGLGTFRKLAEAYPSLPLVLLTGLNDQEIAIQAVREGAQDYLNKGEVDGQILVRSIDYAIERKRIQAELERVNAQVKKNADDLHSILNQLHIGTILTNPEGRILHMSISALRLLGKMDNGLEGQLWQHALGLTDDDIQILDHLMTQPIEERKKVLVHFTPPGNSPHWLEIDIQDDPRDPQAKMFFLYDVTEVHKLRQQLDEKSQFHDMIGKCKPMQEVYRQIQNLSQVETTVLIEGETGTGKELVARALHYSSPRKDKPFLAVNCAGLTESLLGSQLFGHKKGAFTGASTDHRGFFESAQGGTLFLDEIGDMPPSVQTNLLRVLQEKEITRLGESQPRKVDVRIICATHQNLNEQVANNQFRADLLYRIRVGRIRLPALRERKEDIPLLVSATLSQCRQAMGKLIVQDISPSALHLLSDYAWPGNVREFKSVIEYAVLQCEGSTILPQHFPPELLEQPNHTAHQENLELPTALPEKNREQILSALQQTKGNRAKAAKLMGISRATFYRWLDDLNISTQDLS
ncbi:sigma 54-interacting transcriptional regulator [Candidatus Nitronereus thalassa]|uniref:Sigma 54-interacting transcriptional regulator n=1 Tax=Candidatus Nitronereus thalassa TaxID=3020898 RepID=A0ABU3K7Y1_9BACT|nr:sigma 54-interacting transcriptional regulator [Candidatus Nitronereus thalassa]MDT7042506.1 sigma 54-interacting transcriptional regulator [Candidatus Nitronereus thalassa]